jgi:hypothetical protein
MADLFDAVISTFQISSKIPWVDQINSGIIKMFDVSGGQRGSPGEGDGRDHTVTKIASAAFGLPSRHQISCLFGGGTVKRQNSTF